MSATLRIDTLKFVRRLTDAGMERPMAEALMEADTSGLATKADLKSDLAALKAELKADINAVRFEAAENKSELFRFMMLQVATTVGLTVALIKLLP